LASTRREDDANNKAIESQSFGKDEDEDHSNKKLWLLSVGSAKIN